jgi:hypothetical protein
VPPLPAGTRRERRDVLRGSRLNDPAERIARRRRALYTALGLISALAILAAYTVEVWLPYLRRILAWLHVPLGALLVAATLLLAPGAARADEVRMDNGDVIRGEVIGADDTTLRVKHVYGTEVLLPWAKVASIATDKPIELRLIDGTRLKGKLSAGPDPHTAAVASEGVGAIPSLELDRVVAVNEPAESALWNGRISVGITVQDGNTRSKTMFGSFDAERLTKSDRIEAHGYYSYGVNEKVLATKKGFARVQYSYYVYRPLYPTRAARSSTTSSASCGCGRAAAAARATRSSSRRTSSCGPRAAPST